MELIAHHITILRAMKEVVSPYGEVKSQKSKVKFTKIADKVTADAGKLQNKCHSPHYEGNGKKIRRRNRKI